MIYFLFLRSAHWHIGDGTNQYEMSDQKLPHNLDPYLCGGGGAQNKVPFSAAKQSYVEV